MSEASPEETTRGVLRKIVSLEASEQLKGLEMLEKLLEISGNFPIYELVSGEEFTAGLRRVLDRKDLDKRVHEKLISLVDVYGKRFLPISDLLPGLVLLRADLIVQGLVVDEGAYEAQPAEEGQDPEEFMAEVSATVRLFTAVVTHKKGDKQALITLAMNLDRYQEQLEIWLNMLEGVDAEWRTRANDLMNKVNQALDQYRSLRI